MGGGNGLRWAESLPRRGIKNHEVKGKQLIRVDLCDWALVIMSLRFGSGQSKCGNQAELRSSSGSNDPFDRNLLRRRTHLQEVLPLNSFKLENGILPFPQSGFSTETIHPLTAGLRDPMRRVQHLP